MSLLDAAWIALSVLGHFAFWAGCFGRLHALSWPHKTIEFWEKAIAAAALFLPPAVAWALLVSDRPWAADIALAYFWAGVGSGIFVSGRWLRRKLRRRTPHLRSESRRIGSLPEDVCGDRQTRWWSRLPGNQILQIEFSEKTLALPRLDSRLDGLRIAHLSDLHFTGQLSPEFFQAAIDQVNAWDVDLVLLTGDIIDDETCLPWISQLLGQVQSRHGAFYVLGNHDLRLPDLEAIHRETEQAGWRYVGGASETVEIRGASILLAGNEAPWFAAPQAIPQTDGLRILLSHAPDVIEWAQAEDFDLMLAGHTHGGQVRLPLFGPLIAQSLYGVRYSCGVFYESPTLLHVVRGLSGVQTLRVNCRPEATLIVLTGNEADGLY